MLNHWVEFEKGEKLLERYTIIDKIAETKMSILYKAHDETQDIDVCLKFPHPAIASDEHSLDYIKKEFMTTTKLNHDNIVKSYKVEMLDGKPFFVMEYIEGKNLESIVAEQVQLPYETIYNYAKQIMSALIEAHHKKIVHRDLKIKNIIINNNGILKIIDFGIARVVKDTFTKLTNESVPGTRFYMAPELLRGKVNKLGAATDWYAFGVILYEMVVGHPPFYQGDITHQHLNEMPPDINTLRNDCPPALASLVMLMLEKDPDIRQSNIQNFINTIEALSSNDPAQIEKIEIGITEIPKIEQPNKRKRTISKALILISTLAAIFLMMAILFAWKFYNIHQNADFFEGKYSNIRERLRNDADALTNLKRSFAQLADSIKTLRHEVLQRQAKISAELRSEFDQTEKKLTSKVDKGVASINSIVELNALPIGSIIPYEWYLNRLPSSWKLCDGQLVNDPESPYNGYQVPDLRGYFIRGAERNESTRNEGGVDYIENHYHSISSHKHEVGNHAHVVTITDDTYEYYYFYNILLQTGGSSWVLGGKNIADLNHSHVGTTDYAGSGYTSKGGDGNTNNSGGHDNRPKFKSFYYIIKIK